MYLYLHVNGQCRLTLQLEKQEQWIRPILHYEGWLEVLSVENRTFVSYSITSTTRNKNRFVMKWVILFSLAGYLQFEIYPRLSTFEIRFSEIGGIVRKKRFHHWLKKDRTQEHLFIQHKGTSETQSNTWRY